MSLRFLQGSIGYVDKSGHLSLEGFNAMNLANKWGTPLFAFSKQRLRDNFHKLSSSLKLVYPNSKVFYACKANGLLAILFTLREEGAGIEIGSEGELYLAQLAGFSREEIIFNGNSKSEHEIRLALSQNVVINIDSMDEVETIVRCAKDLGCIARVCIRVVPGVHSRTIEEFATGIPESKFGLDIKSGEASDVAKEIAKHKELKLIGVHCHIGSQIISTQPYESAINSVISFAADLERATLSKLEIINLGGGFGIPQERLEDVPTLETFGQILGGAFKQCCEKFGLKDVMLIVEPGASIVGTSGVVLLKVNSVKHRKNGTIWVSVDGGADILLRATQGWYKFPVVDANDPIGPKKITANIAGPLCYSGDVIAYGVELPEIKKGSVLAVLNSGAYTFCLLNSYNGRLSPAVIMLENGCDNLVSRRGEPADLVIRERQYLDHISK